MMIRKTLSELVDYGLHDAEFHSLVFDFDNKKVVMKLESTYGNEKFNIQLFGINAMKIEKETNIKSRIEQILFLEMISDNEIKIFSTSVITYYFKFDDILIEVEVPDVK